MEVRRHQPLAREELCHLFGAPAGGAIHDGAPRLVVRQTRIEHGVNVLVLARRVGLHHLELEVVALGAAVEHRKLDAKLLAEVVADVAHHVGLGGGGQAHDGRRLSILASALADEAPDVAIVGAEVVAPAGQAVRLVHHPSAHFPLRECPSEGAVAKLLR